MQSAPTTNAETLAEIFGSLPPDLRSWVANVAGNPKTALSIEWAGQPATPWAIPEGLTGNHYFTLAIYRGRRCVANCIVIYGVMLDDVGQRYAGPLALPPSILVETSPGNFQAIYLFATPETDRARVASLQRALIAAGLCDPGADVPATRYCRLPFGINGKHSPPFPCRLAEWHPERRYTIEQITAGLGLVIDPPMPPRAERTAPAWEALPEEKRREILADLRAALATIPADDRPTWISVGQALAGMGDDGCALWVEWSKTSHKFNPGDEDRFDGFLGDSTGYASIFNRAARYGWVNPRRRDPSAIFSAAEPFVLPPGASLVPLQPAAPLVPPAPPREIAPLPAPFTVVRVDDVATVPPAPQVFYVAGILPAGHTSLLGGHGGTGKTSLAQQLGVCVAAGLPFLGLPTKRGRVVYFSAEDPGSLVRRRLARICRCLGVDPATLAQVLHVLDATEGSPALFTERRDRGARVGVLTATYEALREYILTHAIDVVIVDNASDAFDADEISRASVREFIRALALLVRPRDGAVLLLAHVDKNTSRAGKQAGSEAYSGSTAWHNSVRSRLFLVETGPGLLELQHQKSNLGPRIAPLNLLWPADGVLQVIDGPHGPGASDTDLRALLALLAEFAGRGEYPSTSPQGRPSIAQIFAGERTYPRHLKPAEVFDVLRDGERRGFLAREQFRKANRKEGERFAITDAGRYFLAAAPSAPSAPSHPLSAAGTGAPSARAECRGGGGVGAHSAPSAPPPCLPATDRPERLALSAPAGRSASK